MDYADLLALARQAGDKHVSEALTQPTPEIYNQKQQRELPEGVQLDRAGVITLQQDDIEMQITESNYQSPTNPSRSSFLKVRPELSEESRAKNSTGATSDKEGSSPRYSADQLANKVRQIMHKRLSHLKVLREPFEQRLKGYNERRAVVLVLGGDCLREYN
jgi:hypothetical protein